jgi:hypothetical protein
VSFGLLRLQVEANGETPCAGCRLNASSRHVLPAAAGFCLVRQTHDRPFPDLHRAGRRRHPHAAPHAHASPLTTAFLLSVSPLTIALTSEASTWAMLMLGFGGLGFAAFSVGMKVGQIAEAAWWKGKLQEAPTSTREPLPPRQMSLVRERQELGESPLRPGSLLRRPPPVRWQAGPLASQRVLRGARQGGLFRSDGRAP